MAFVNQQIKKQLAPAIKDVLKKYGVKGSISVSNHSTLCVTLTSGDINLCEGKARVYFQVNEYQLDNHYDGVVRDFFKELADAMRGPDFFDHSDSMTDYFHLSHYIRISVGRFDKPYVCNTKEAA